MIVGLCGNPNVGKSTLFNRLTGMRQHTGNWPGKTVGSAVGQWGEHTLLDTPGSYSLSARSAEEEVTRDYILFGGAERLLMVADACDLRRSLLLVLQVLELRGDVVLCLNLTDEAKRRGIRIDSKKLSTLLGIPVLPMCAAGGEGVEAIAAALCRLPAAPLPPAVPPWAKSALQPLAAYLSGLPLPALWLARALLAADEALKAELCRRLCLDPRKDLELARLITAAEGDLAETGHGQGALAEAAALRLAARADEICRSCVVHMPSPKPWGDRFDRLFTHRLWGVPCMLLLLSGILWLSIKAANVPSEYLSRWLFSAGDWLRAAGAGLGLPPWLLSALFDGVWLSTAWVVGVMLPPMAIFFPLFTLLEDLGVLPRVAFNLDGAFQRCGACGKQGLCMMMGLGCNAVGVTGCRIIDSPRERLIAQLTNAFMPCNGRFPMMLTLLTVFFGAESALAPAALMTLLLLLGVLLTFGVSFVLSRTILRGEKASFALELPPYRRPMILRVLLRSVLDRTALVLGRAVCVAAPAGLLIWFLANTEPGGVSLLERCRCILEGPGRLFCMDGAVLLGFLLALPANEITVPAILLIYHGAGQLVSFSTAAELEGILLAQGWDGFTAAAVLLFSLCHWPCGTTLLTLRRECGSWGYTALAALLPTVCGVGICLLLSLLRRFLVA